MVPFARRGQRFTPNHSFGGIVTAVRTNLPSAALLVVTAVLGFQVWFLATTTPDSVRVGLVFFSDSLGIPFNTLLVYLGSASLGALAGVIGSFAVLRRRALLGDAIAHAALPGLCLAFVVAGMRKDLGSMLIGATLTGLLGVAVVQALTRLTRIPQDAAIAIVLSVFFGVGLALARMIQNTPTGALAGLDGYLLGSTAGMVTQDVLWLGLGLLNGVLVVGALFKEFTLVTFDPAFAGSLGWPVARLDGLILLAVVAVTMLGLPAVGVVMIAALLILPGVTARLWTERLGSMLVLAAGFGVVMASLGTWISANPESWLGRAGRGVSVPAGPAIILSGSALFLLSACLAPRRGILARALKLRRDARDWRVRKLLRVAYSFAGSGRSGERWLDQTTLLQARSWSAWELSAALGSAKRAGWLEGPTATSPLHESQAGRWWRLTPRGLHMAAQLVAADRAWDLVQVGAVAEWASADEVDRTTADLASRLPREALERLESMLRAADRWPAEAASWSGGHVDASADLHSTPRAISPHTSTGASHEGDAS